MAMPNSCPIAVDKALAVLIAAVLLSCSFSICHLYSNQLSYYIPFVSHFNPDNFARDWFVQDAHTHPGFGYITIAMGYFLDLKQISVVGALVCWLLISIGYYLIVQLLYPDRCLLAFAVTIVSLIGFGVPGVGGMHT